MRRLSIVFVLCALHHAPALAQDTYVGAALTGDIVRFDGPEETRSPEFSGGEALGFALRLGTRIGPAWGIEAEFSRAGEIRNEGTPEVVPLPALDALTITGPDGQLVTIPVPSPAIFPPLEYRVRTAYRDLTFSAAVWARQAFSSRFALVYSGGVGFHRSEREVEFRFEPSPFPFPRLTVPPTIAGSALAILDSGIFASRTVAYTTRPFAGVDARIAMTDRVDLVPGIRVHGLDGGLLLRPSVGVSWRF